MQRDSQTRSFSDRYNRLIASSILSLDTNPASHYRTDTAGVPFSERLLQCIWFDQLFDPDLLQTVDGIPVRVLSPGFWNLEAGPDFLRAEIAIGEGPPVKGDIEVHLVTADWVGHGHSTDPRYDRTILHVALERPKVARTVKTHDGQTVPQVCLGDALTDELSALRERIRTEDYPYGSTHNVGRCYRDALTGDAGEFWTLVRLAGEARMLGKAQRASAIHTDWDEVCYAMLLQALGYKAFAQQCLALARRVPYTFLTRFGPDVTMAIEATLLGAAGLLPDNSAIKDDAGVERASRLRDAWDEVSLDAEGIGFTEKSWRAPHVRPANQPARRLAAAAQLIATFPMDRGLAETWRESVMHGESAKGAWRSMEEQFVGLSNPFWESRGSLSGCAWRTPQRLIGASRARVLMIDAVVPSLLAQARAEKDAQLEHRLYDMMRTAPAQSLNARLKLALYRMRGAQDAWPRDQRSALTGQGLLHILGEWCIDRPSCEGCGVHRALASRHIPA